jgi:D-arabinose 1-dehydrogenase-like Zn-dependent alcohol dehydrogenase
VWRESFLFQIPDGLTSEEAAPLMCAGASVFSVLNAYDVKAYHRVGVLGVGGLGHLAIQFASKMGCEVVVFSSTASKKAEALQFGAKEFYTAADLGKTENIRPIDHLLVTAHSLPDWNMYELHIQIVSTILLTRLLYRYLPLMAKGGTIYPITISLDTLALPALAMNMSGIGVQGSLIASRFLLKKMLDFAAYHEVKPVVQTWPMNVQGIKEAFTSLETNHLRYRAVVVAES